MQTAQSSASQTTDEIAMRYFDAWNLHDPDAVASCFGAGGTYSDPAARVLSGPAIGGYVAELLAAFPDLAFELVDTSRGDHGDVMVEWIMRGTNGGPFLGMPPTGETIALDGAAVISVESGQIRSLRSYFDQKSLAEQAGLQAVIMPVTMGPFAFGYAVHACRDGKTTPGAFSVTSISSRSPQESEEIDKASLEIVSELLETPGFLSWLGVTVGDRGFTITAWEDAQVPQHLTRGGPHREAMAKFFGSEWASGGFTSVWSPERINALWVRCAACGTPIDSNKAHGVCGCGAALPEPPPYF